jgi:hypothetical protein
MTDRYCLSNIAVCITFLPFSSVRAEVTVRDLPSADTTTAPAIATFPASFDTKLSRLGLARIAAAVHAVDRDRHVLAGLRIDDRVILRRSLQFGAGFVQLPGAQLRIRRQTPCYAEHAQHRRQADRVKSY